MKVIWKKNTDENNKTKRICLNCGQDITNKRKDAKFCCPTCYQAYTLYKEKKDEDTM